MNTYLTLKTSQRGLFCSNSISPPIPTLSNTQPKTKKRPYKDLL
nr:MAG TPA: hypothetical protein [Caudoviricetes sp.]